jgi:hypothetical protein
MFLLRLAQVDARRLPDGYSARHSRAKQHAAQEQAAAGLVQRVVELAVQARKRPMSTGAFAVRRSVAQAIRQLLLDCRLRTVATRAASASRRQQIEHRRLFAVQRGRHTAAAGTTNPSDSRRLSASRIGSRLTPNAPQFLPAASRRRLRTRRSGLLRAGARRPVRAGWQPATGRFFMIGYYKVSGSIYGMSDRCQPVQQFALRRSAGQFGAINIAVGQCIRSRAPPAGSRKLRSSRRPAAPATAAKNEPFARSSRRSGRASSRAPLDIHRALGHEFFTTVPGSRPPGAARDAVRPTWPQRS